MSTNTNTNTNTTNLKKFKREYRLPRIEFIAFQLDQTINHTQNILSKTEIHVLAYIYCYGVEASDRLYTDRILTNTNSIVNYISKLTRMNYAIKEPNLEARGAGKKGYSNIYLNPDLGITDDGFIQISIVLPNKESDEVYHPHFRK